MAKFRAVKSTSFARRVLAVLSLGIGLYTLGTTTGIATAQPSRSASQKLEAIRQLMEKGQGQYLAGNYQGAADIFEGGFKQYPYSAFLFNAGVCYQKLGESDRALVKFRDYLKVDPNAPDLEKVNQRIAALEAAKGIPAAPVTDAGVGGTAPVVPTPTPVVPAVDDESAMRSLVVVETEPADAPLRFYSRTDPNAAAFTLGSQNLGPALCILNLPILPKCQVKITTSALPAGDVTITAKYAGNLLAQGSAGTTQVKVLATAGTPFAPLLVRTNQIGSVQFDSG